MNSPEYLATIRRRKSSKIKQMIGSLAKKASRDDFEAFTFKVVYEVRELLTQLSSVPNEGNTREILRQIRDSFLDGGHEKYRNRKAREVAEAIFERLSQADDVTPDDVDLVSDKFDDGGLAWPLPALFVVEGGNEETHG